VKDKKYAYLTFAVIVGFLIFRIFYLATTHYTLSQDEAYFWDWSRHPALSYYDMGPMIAWIIAFFTHILPLSAFSVRLGAPVFAAMTAVVIYVLTVEVTESSMLGFITVLMFHILPIGMAGGIIMTYYSPQVFFMSLTALFLWKLITDGRPWWWYLIGLSAGLGLLSHHMFIFFTAEVGLFVLLSRNNRKWLRRKEPYLALLIELIVASPIVIWNATHDFVMFRHAIGMMSETKDISFTLFEYIGGQAGIGAGFFFIAVVYGLIVSGYRGIKFKDDKYLFLFCISAPVILFIALLSLGGRTEPNWPVSGYITGSIAAVDILYEKYKKGNHLLRLLINAGLGLTILVCALASVFAYYPSVMHAMGIYIPPQRDPTNRLYGWKELGENVSDELKDMPADSFVATGEYGLNAELAFYVKGHPQVYEIPVSRRFSQYDFWNNFRAVKGKDAVYVGYGPIGKQTYKLFNKVVFAKELVIRTLYDNAVRFTFYIYKCYGYKGTAKELATY
jgi:4-amino-4-deoxy-L-arabinose transferase-like glycosyltransferase